MRERRGRFRWAWTPVVAGLPALLALTAAAALVVLALPGGSALAQDPQPPADPEPYFGYNEDWATHFDRLDLAALGGADVSRAVISWRAIEPRRGELFWEPYDRLYARMLETGTRPLWVLADAPCWAWATRTRRCRERDEVGRPPRRSHDDEWAQFAAAVVQRYPEAVAIETWNEPNLDNFWRPRPDPARAAAVTAAANLGVKSVDPEMPVVLGGLSPLYETIPEKGEIAYDEFIREAYAAAAPGSWDAVAMHPFPRFKSGDAYLADVLEHLDAVRAALVDSKAAGTPIWVTEIGLSTGGPFPHSRRAQARGLKRIYKALAEMPDVPAVIVHRLVDLSPTVTTAEAGWGVIGYDGRLKPAYCALARVRGLPCPTAPPRVGGSVQRPGQPAARSSARPSSRLTTGK